MAFERNPDDPSRTDRSSEELLRLRAEQLDARLQPDPELREGPASGGRIALFAIALVAILGVVLYGLNSSTTTPEPTSTAQTAPAGGTAAPAPRPPAGQTTGQAPNAPAGQTTGSAPAPAQPTTPAPAPAAPAPAAPAK